jgi:hypothetical protein
MTTESRLHFPSQRDLFDLTKHLQVKQVSKSHAPTSKPARPKHARAMLPYEAPAKFQPIATRSR